MTAKDILLALLDEGYDKTSWHGPNLRGALRGLKEPEIDWRPAPGRHSVRELAIHAAYWKYRVRRRLTGDEEAVFALPGSDWFKRERGRSWAQELALLADEHKRLRTAVTSLSNRRINQPLLSNGATAAYLIRGIAAHDLYHAGQIRMLRRLMRNR